MFCKSFSVFQVDCLKPSLTLPLPPSLSSPVWPITTGDTCLVAPQHLEYNTVLFSHHCLAFYSLCYNVWATCVQCSHLTLHYTWFANKIAAVMQLHQSSLSILFTNWFETIVYCLLITLPNKKQFG